MKIEKIVKKLVDNTIGTRRRIFCKDCGFEKILEPPNHHELNRIVRGERCENCGGLYEIQIPLVKNGVDFGWVTEWKDGMLFTTKKNPPGMSFNEEMDFLLERLKDEDEYSNCKKLLRRIKDMKKLDCKWAKKEVRQDD